MPGTREITRAHQDCSRRPRSDGNRQAARRRNSFAAGAAEECAARCRRPAACEKAVASYAAPRKVSGEAEGAQRSARRGGGSEAEQHKPRVPAPAASTFHAPPRSTVQAIPPEDHATRPCQRNAYPQRGWRLGKGAVRRPSALGRVQRWRVLPNPRGKLCAIQCRENSEQVSMENGADVL